MAVYDIATRFIPEDHRIWVLHAGRGKRQFNVFRDQSVAFLEMPGFAATKDTFEQISAIRQHLRMSDAIRAFYARPTGNFPSRNPASYPSGVSDDRSFNANVGNIKSLFSEARPGDLLIVPGLGQYSPVLIGEITESFNSEHTVVVAHFEPEAVPYRPVKWITTSVEKRHFSKALSRRLENRHAIIEISTNELRKEIYDITYDNYTLGSYSKSTFFGPIYDSKDPSGILLSIEFIRYFVSANNAYSRREIERFSSMSVKEAIASYYDPSTMRDFSLEFQSPGKILVGITAPLAAIVVALAVAVSVDTLAYQDVINTIKIENSVDNTDEPAIQPAADIYKGIMNSIGEERFNETRKMALEAKRAIGFSTDITRVE